MSQKSLQLRLLFLVEIFWAFARRPKDVLELVLYLVEECSTEVTKLLFAQHLNTVEELGTVRIVRTVPESE